MANDFDFTIRHRQPCGRSRLLIWLVGVLVLRSGSLVAAKLPAQNVPISFGILLVCHFLLQQCR